MPEYKQYILNKIIKATPMTRGCCYEMLGKTIMANDERPEDKGYHVICSEDKELWCPQAEFEARCQPIEGMTFGMAIEALKKGHKVARRGWNGKGMFLWLKPATIVKAEWCKDEMLREIVESNGGEILGLGTICMYTHDSTGRKAVLSGWLASQSDMLYDDWEIVG